jgi:hypothetical protein
MEEMKDFVPEELKEIMLLNTDVVIKGTLGQKLS